MVDQQEFHHAAPRLAHHRRCRCGPPCRRRPDRRRRRSASAPSRPRPGTCGNCRRPTAARGSRSAGFPRPPASQACSTSTPFGTSTSMPSTVTFAIARYSAAIGSGRADSPLLVGARCALPSPAGNAGSGPGSARPPHRRARRSCGPRSAASPAPACRSRPARRGPRPCGPSPASSSPCPRGTACTGRSSRACRTGDSRAIALMMSVDLSITITAAVPSPLLHVAQAVEIHQHGVADRLRAAAAPRSRRGSPPAGCPSRRARRRHRFSISSRSGMPSSSSTLHGLFTWPGDAEDLGAGVLRPAECREPGARRAAGSSARRRCVSTLLTVVGQP